LGGGKLEIQKIEEKVRDALRKGKGIATGIGIFAAIFKENSILLRRRVEKGSLIYGKDLSGKWELPGGGVELTDFGEDYQSVIKHTLVREIREETGLEIDIEKVSVVLLPAILKKSSIEKLNLIDWAFVVPMDAKLTRETEEYKRKLEKGEICWVPINEIDRLEIVSERMRYLIGIAINFTALYKMQI
jgi:8-oxo-dGTP pyrophosphatase MutT (NUDIX family)